MDESTLKTESALVLQSASNLLVLTNDDYDAAGNARKGIKYTMKQITDYWAPKKDQAFQLHKSLVAAEKEMLDPLNKADKIIDQRMADYRREVERQRIEAERERQRLLAEQRRLEEEARQKAEEAQRLINEARQKDELDDDDVEILHIAQAEAAQAEQAIVAPVDVFVPDQAKTQGISVRKTWKARVVAEYKVPVAVAGVTIRPIDQSALNKLAALSEGKAECPGVEFYQEESTRVNYRV